MLKVNFCRKFKFQQFDFRLAYTVASIVPTISIAWRWFSYRMNGKIQEITSLSSWLLLLLLLLLLPSLWQHLQHWVYILVAFHWHSHQSLWEIKRQLHIFHHQISTMHPQFFFYYQIFTCVQYFTCWENIVYPILIDYVKQNNKHARSLLTIKTQWQQYFGWCGIFVSSLICYSFKYSILSEWLKFHPFRFQL